jgi:bacterioferritin-associated ferredoxin
MIVCICHRISDHDIARAVRAGCASFDELQDELSVATACGACRDCACSTFELHAAQAGRVPAVVVGHGAVAASPASRLTVIARPAAGLAAGA